MPAPRFLGYQALLGEPKPINWKGIGQALWDTNLNAPVRGVYNLMNADPYTLYTDEGAAGQQAAVDSFDAGGGITVGSAMVPKPSNALSMGIKAYHGSPHSFDKFSMDKIGTGEGAQAYGHGLYFAENEGVAKGYRDALTDPNQVKIRINDKEIPSVWNDDLRNTYPELYKGLNPSDQDTMDSLLGTMESAFSMDDAARAADSVGGRAKTLFQQRIKPGLTKPEVGPGSMYEVNIDADPNAFLDWDKPLSEQPEAVQKLFPKDVYGHKYDQMNGSDVYENLIDNVARARTGKTSVSSLAPSDRTGAVEMFRQAGVPGIRYLDAGSRNGTKVQQIEKQLAPWKARLEQDPTNAYVRQEVEGLQMDLEAEMAKPQSRNYVVFDDKLISIVKKYGIAGASAMLGYNLLEGVDKSQAAELQQADTHHQYTSWLNSGGI